MWKKLPVSDSFRLKNEHSGSSCFYSFESWFDVSELCKEGGDEHIVEMERENHILSTLHEVS